jgi:hypothetical protein
MKTLQCVILLFFLLFCGSAVSDSNFESIGFVNNIIGDVYLKTPAATVRAAPNMKINQGDTIITAKKSSAGLIFDDDTVVSLGPESEIQIESFLFKPVEKELSFIARMIQGTFSLISGKIAKLAPDKVKIETPDATLGVRGTKILVKTESSICK